MKVFKDIITKYFKTNILFTTFVLGAVINGCLLRFLTVKNFFAFKPIIGDLTVILIIGAIGYLFKPKHQFKYYLFWSVFFATLCLINSIYYTNFVSFASVSLLATSTQVVDVSDAVFKNIMELKDFCYLWHIFAIVFVNHVLKKNNYYFTVGSKENGKKNAVNTLVAGLITLGFFVCMLTTIDISRLGKQWNRESVVMSYGIYIYQVNDVIASIQPQISPLFGYDNKMKEFREYYSAKDQTPKTNKYTNMFKGKNIITIHAESIQKWLMDASFNGLPVTPNLNRLAKEGLFFSNFYSQESVGTSSDSEFTLNTSLMPSSSGTVFMSYYDRKYVTIPKLLKDQNYYAFSMHGNKGAYWNRDIVHKNFGYDKFYYHNKEFTIDETIGLGLSDKSFFRQAVPKIKKISETKQNFYGTMIMLTNHTPFTDIERVSDYAVDYKYQKLNETTNQLETVSAPFLEGTKIGSYVKSAHYADEAIGQFIEDLNNQGVLENTVIVIYGDHDAKLKKSEYLNYYNYDPKTNTTLSTNDPNYKTMDFYDYELNRKVPFIIWSKGFKEPKEVTKVMGMYDVLPTLGNMFGFNNSYALGHDIFSIDENVVVFPDGNWLTDKMYYNSQKREGKLININETVSVEYIQKYCEYSEKVISVSDAIIVYDLINKASENKKILEEISG